MNMFGRSMPSVRTSIRRSCLPAASNCTSLPNPLRRYARVSSASRPWKTRCHSNPVSRFTSHLRRPRGDPQPIISPPGLFGCRAAVLCGFWIAARGRRHACFSRAASTSARIDGAELHHRIIRRCEMTLAIGDTAPNFETETTEGRIRFHDWIGDRWAVLFSHPKDFTPVCTTELGYMAKMKPEFDKRNVKIIGLSVDPVESHAKWANDI